MENLRKSPGKVGKLLRKIAKMVQKICGNTAAKVWEKCKKNSGKIENRVRKNCRKSAGKLTEYTLQENRVNGTGKVAKQAWRVYEKTVAKPPQNYERKCAKTTEENAGKASEQ